MSPTAFRWLMALLIASAVASLVYFFGWVVVKDETAWGLFTLLYGIVGLIGWGVMWVTVEEEVYETVEPLSALVDKHGNIIKLHQTDKQTYRQKYLKKAGVTVYSFEEQWETVRIKLGDYHYILKIKAFVGDNPEYFKRFLVAAWRMKPGSQDLMEHFLEYVWRRFHQEHRDQVVEICVNPLADEQQEQFFELVKSTIGESLAEAGILIRNTEFSAV